MILLFLQSPRVKAMAVILVLLVLLIPVYGGVNWLRRVLQPASSPVRLMGWLMAVLAWVFLATGLIVLAVRLLFVASS